MLLLLLLLLQRGRRQDFGLRFPRLSAGVARGEDPRPQTFGGRRL